MKNALVRWFISALAATVFAASSAAQNFAVLNKEARFVQTSATTVSPAPGLPFAFIANIEGGTATSPTPPNTFTLPNNLGTRTLTFSDGDWQFGQEFATQAALDAAYPNGTYAFNFGGRSVNLPFSGGFPAPPTITVTGGTFNNGVLVVERASALTITVAWPQNFVAGSSRLGVWIDPAASGLPPVNFESSNEGSGFATSQITLNVPANSLAAGGTYELGAEANRALVLDTTSAPGFTVVSVFTSTVTIRVNVTGPQPPPVFVQQPQSRTVATGSTVVFTAFANGATRYQWRRDGADIAGATGATLVLSGASTIGGDYSVLAINPSASTPSANARLNVSSTVNFGRLINLSILTDIRTPGDSFTLGYVVGGAGPSGAKPLVIRAAAPALAAIGVPGTLNDPRIQLFANGAATLTNDNWGGTLALINAFSAVGAFPFTNPASLDAAVLAEITTRDNSVGVSATGSGTGKVIAEVYDATPQASITASTPRLLNVAVLKTLDAGTSMTAGFVLRGQTARTVLIRAIGPGLNAVFGIPDALSDPQLTLYGAGSTRIAQNNDWGGDPAIVAAASAIGAFAITNGGSRDAMLLMTLPSGDYSVEVSGTAGGGSVIVEVYEVP